MDYTIKLGVTVDTDGLQGKINAATKNLKPIELDVELGDVGKEIKQLKAELNSLNKKNILNLNTESVEHSLNEVAATIKEIKSSLGSLDTSKGIGSLLSSVSQITTAIGKAESETESLVKSLNTLSKKDFNINLGVKFGGGNAFSSNTAYGNNVRSVVLPQLREQADALMKAIRKEYAEFSDWQSDEFVLETLSKRKSYTPFKSVGLLQKETMDGRNLSKQMSAYREYINVIEEIGRLSGVDVSSVTSGFSKTRDELIQGAIDIQAGVKNAAENAEDSMQKLKQVFGGGTSDLNLEGLSTALKPITEDINSIRAAVEGLSRGVSIDELTSSFNRLSEVLDKLEGKLKSAQDIIGSVGGSGQTSGGLGSVTNDLQQVESAVNSTIDAIGHLEIALRTAGLNDSSISKIYTKFGEHFKEIEAATAKINKNGTLSVSVKGVNEDGNALTVVKDFEKASGELLSEGRTVASSFDTSADAAKRWKKEVSNAYQDAKKLKTEIGSLEVDLIGAKAKNDTKEIDRITNRISALKTELKGIKDVYGDSFTTRHNNLLKQLDDKITDNKVKAENDVANKSELTETEAAFKRLKSLGKEISGLEIEIAGLDADKNVADIDKLTARLRTLETEYDNLFNANEQKFTTSQIDSLTQDIADSSQKLESFKDKIASLRAEAAKSIKLDIEVGKFDNQIDDLESRLDRLSTEGTEEVRRSLEKVKSAYQEMQFAAGRDSKDVVDEKWLAKSQEEYAAAVQKTTNLLKQQERAERELDRAQKLTSDRESLSLDMQNWLKENTRAAKKYGDAIRELDANLRKLEKSGNLTEGDNKAARRQFNNWTKKAKSEGLTGLTWFDSLKEKFKQYSSYFSVAELFMYAEQGLTDMFEQVKLIDSAMTELKKVTNETDASYDKFLTNAASRAKEIGTTIDGLVSSTADFARLGYGFNESAGLAEVANIYTVVGDEIDSVDTATESLVSTLAAFKGEMGDMSDSEFAMSIVDKFNEVSKLIA